MHMATSTRLNGSAIRIAPVFSALSPSAPTSNREAATRPSMVAQRTRLHFGGSVSPPDASMSTTREPESDDVKIGRASCRERVYKRGVDGGLQKVKVIRRQHIHTKQ